MKDKTDYEGQLDYELSRLRDIALKSTDVFVVSKSVAASDPSVRERILKRLRDGERLVEVLSWGGVSRTEIKVFFRFIRDGQSVQIVDVGFLVFVDSVRGEVLGVVDPYVLQPAERLVRPFVLISPPSDDDTGPGAGEYRAAAARQKAFLENVGLEPPDPWGGVYTVYDTIFGTETPGDTRSDRTCDYRDCAPAPSSGEFFV